MLFINTGPPTGVTSHNPTETELGLEGKKRHLRFRSSLKKTIKMWSISLLKASKTFNTLLISTTTSVFLVKVCPAGYFKRMHKYLPFQETNLV